VATAPLAKEFAGATVATALAVPAGVALADAVALALALALADAGGVRCLNRNAD
jgi:hypothetical protein